MVVISCFKRAISDEDSDDADAEASAAALLPLPPPPLANEAETRRTAGSKERRTESS